MDAIDIDYQEFFDIPINNENNNEDINNQGNEINQVRNDLINRDYFFYEISTVFMDSFYTDNFEFNVNDRFNINNYNSFITAQTNYYKNQIFVKALFSILRVIILYLLFVIDGYIIDGALSFLVIFLLIHEACLISNYISMKLYFCFVNNILRDNQPRFPKIILMFDIFASLVYFFWFIYGISLIMFKPDVFQVGISKNTYVIYFLTLLVLFGFFQFSRLIFFVIMFIFFYPCFSYIIYTNYNSIYNRMVTNHRIAMDLTPMIYKDFIIKTKENIENVNMCIICTEEFKGNDEIVVLKCSTKHVFHENCIKQWIGKKAECPICRYDLTK